MASNRITGRALTAVVAAAEHYAKDGQLDGLTVREIAELLARAANVPVTPANARYILQEWQIVYRKPKPGDPQALDRGFADLAFQLNAAETMIEAIRQIVVNLAHQAGVDCSEITLGADYAEHDHQINPLALL